MPTVRITGLPVPPSIPRASTTCPPRPALGNMKSTLIVVGEGCTVYVPCAKAPLTVASKPLSAYVGVVVALWDFMSIN